MAGFIEKIKGVDKRIIFVLILLFLLGFGIRGHLLKYDLMYEFDTYFHTKVVSYVLQYGFVPDKDPLAYWQIGGSVLDKTNYFFWYFNAAVYKLVYLGAPYSKAALIELVRFLPAIYGALTAVALFFFGKEIYGKEAGYAMAFVGAVIPAFVYRTMAGFFEEDALGFLWMVIGFVFFARAMKSLKFDRSTIINAAISGVFFVLMAMTWEMFLLIPLVLVGYFIFGALNIYAKHSKEELFNFFKTFAISFGIFLIGATLYRGVAWVNAVSKYVDLVLPGENSLLIIVGGIAMLGIFSYIILFLIPKEKGVNKTVAFSALALMYIIVIALVFIFATKPDFRGQGIIEQTVGEENTGKQFFGNKYNALIVLPYLALLIIPWRIYREDKEHLSAMIFFWVAITLFMAWYKLKFTYTFGLPIAASAGIITAELLRLVKERPSLEAKAIAVPLALILLVGVASACIFMGNEIPTIDQGSDWKGSLKWINENTPQGSKIFNWWDEGHWISFMGERIAFSDNRNLDFQGESDMARFVITQDLNEGIGIIEKYNPDYVYLSMDMFSKGASLGIYAYNTLNFEDIRLRQYWGVTLACEKQQTQNGINYACGQNNVPESEMSKINTEWSNAPTQIQDGKVPLFIYRDTDNSVIYILNSPTNNSMLTRLWFHEPEAMKHFDESYKTYGIKIFKVKK